MEQIQFINPSQNSLRCRKPRILCLHGFRNNAKFLHDGIHSRWPQTLLHHLDLVFPDAPFAAADPAPPIDGVVFEWFQADQEFKEYQNFEECLKFLEHYLSEHGPFDGILGFSQGAFLAATLPGIQRNRVAFTKVPTFKFFILIAGGKFGHGRFSLPKPATNAFSSPIHCPSLHIIGDVDHSVGRDESEALVNSFVDPVVVYHPEGHVIPHLSEENLEKILEFIQNIQKIL